MSELYLAPDCIAMSASTPTLNERSAEVLRQKILQGEFAPGQRLSEAALSESLGISRNTLREVFRTLAKEGFVHHVPNVGVSVALPSMAAVMDIYRVRRMLECQSLAQGYAHHPAKTQMRRAVEQAMCCRDAGDWAGVGHANIAFHSAIVALADSERLNTMFSQLLSELRLAFGLLNDPELVHAPFVENNVKILELFEAGLLTQSAQALHEYLAHSERLVLSAYARRLAHHSTAPASQQAKI